MAKHTIGFPAETPYRAAKAEAVRILRERGDINDLDTFTVEDGTTEEHTANGERVVIVRVAGREDAPAEDE